MWSFIIFPAIGTESKQPIEVHVRPCLPHIVTKPVNTVCRSITFKNLCGKSQTPVKLFTLFFCLLARISKINRIDGGTRLSPANQILGLSSLARVEALRPGGCWGLGWRRGGRRRAFLSWGAVARVPGTKSGKRVKTIAHLGDKSKSQTNVWICRVVGKTTASWSKIWKPIRSYMTKWLIPKAI